MWFPALLLSVLFLISSAVPFFDSSCEEVQSKIPNLHGINLWSGLASSLQNDYDFLLDVDHYDIIQRRYHELAENVVLNYAEQVKL